MEIKDFRERAMKGGWDNEYAMFNSKHFVPEIMFLDPKAWQAVFPDKEGTTQVGICCKDCGVVDLLWKVKMHQMIDALADGKTIEEYIATL